MSTASAALTAIMADVVSAYVSHNAVPATALPGLLVAVHGTLAGLGAPPAPPPAEAPRPAVPVRDSVADDAITCLGCGRRFQSLKRHLMAEHGLTPEAYRAQWGLSADYPVTAPAYAAQRASIAKRVGLGRKVSA